jgi:hypothetical protein
MLSKLAPVNTVLYLATEFEYTLKKQRNPAMKQTNLKMGYYFPASFQIIKSVFIVIKGQVRNKPK